MAETNRASFRNHPLRRIQSAIGGTIPTIVESMYQLGLLSETAIDDARKTGRPIHANDLTLTGLQLTVRASTEFIDRPGLRSAGRLGLGQLFDALDGQWARQFNQVTTDGAVIDVLADRAAEYHMAAVIADRLAPFISDDYSDELRTAFSLSTLTKAGCEMVGVRTSEGGQGSMLQRRKLLFLTLLKLSLLDQDAGRDDSRAQTRALNIYGSLDQLMLASRQRATERIGQIVADPVYQQRQWDNSALDNPDSSAAVEARKYAAVVIFNKRMGLDMVGSLNALTPHPIFPTAENLQQRYGYVDDCLRSVDPFLNQTLLVINTG